MKGKETDAHLCTECKCTFPCSWQEKHHLHFLNNIYRAGTKFVMYSKFYEVFNLL